MISVLLLSCLFMIILTICKWLEVQYNGHYSKQIKKMCLNPIYISGHNIVMKLGLWSTHEYLSRLSILFHIQLGGASHEEWRTGIGPHFVKKMA